MKVLVAKRPARPMAATERWSAADGEIVVTPFVCDEAGCGCDVLHQGITSHGYSTLAVVRDINVTTDSLIDACRAHLCASQWASVVNDPAELDLIAGELVADMCKAAENRTPGTLLRAAYDRDRWCYREITSPVS